MTNLSEKTTGNNANLLLCEVLNTWDNCKVVYKGTITECEKYISGNNVYQCNYSKLILRRL